MRRMIFVFIFLGLALSVLSVYSQTVTEGEREVYYATVDKASSLPLDASEEDYKKINKKIASKYNITEAEVEEIGKKVWSQDPSKRELEIVKELEDRFADLPEGYTEDQSKEVYEKVAKKYDISLDVLDDIAMRGWTP